MPKIRIIVLLSPHKSHHKKQVKRGFINAFNVIYRVNQPKYLIPLTYLFATYNKKPTKLLILIWVNIVKLQYPRILNGNDSCEVIQHVVAQEQTYTSRFSENSYVHIDSAANSQKKSFSPPRVSKQGIVSECVNTLASIILNEQNHVMIDANSVTYCAELCYNWMQFHRRQTCLAASLPVFHQDQEKWVTSCH